MTKEKLPALLVSLSDHELAQVKPPSEERIKQALERGKRERDAAGKNPRPVPVSPRTLYRYF